MTTTNRVEKRRATVEFALHAAYVIVYRIDAAALDRACTAAALLTKYDGPGPELIADASDRAWWAGTTRVGKTSGSR